VGSDVYVAVEVKGGVKVNVQGVDDGDTPPSPERGGELSRALASSPERWRVRGARQGAAAAVPASSRSSSPVRSSSRMSS
jgi:hypothetical protein